MDNKDIKILELLQNNSRISITDISEEIQLSRPSVKTRIDKMVEDGVIESFNIEVNPKKLGRQIEFICMISDIKESVEYISEEITKMDAITELYISAGKISFIMKGSAPSSEDMHEVIKELLRFGSVETSVILESPLKNKIIKPYDIN